MLSTQRGARVQMPLTTCPRSDQIYLVMGTSSANIR